MKLVKLPFLQLLIAALFSACAAQNPQSASMQDQNPVETLYRLYAESWLSNDSTTKGRVLSLFDNGATIVPSGGQMLFTGREEMQNFWFPPDAPPSTVDQFEHEILDSSMDDQSGFLLGKFRMRFTDPSGSYYTEGYHTLLAEMMRGEWKITTMMWSHPPWEIVE